MFLSHYVIINEGRSCVDHSKLLYPWKNIWRYLVLSLMVGREWASWPNHHLPGQSKLPQWSFKAWCWEWECEHLHQDSFILIWTLKNDGILIKTLTLLNGPFTLSPLVFMLHQSRYLSPSRKMKSWQNCVVFSTWKSVSEYHF